MGTVSTKVKVTSYTVKAFKDSIEDRQFIVNHFKKYPLVSSKYLVFQYWLKAYNILAEKEHFNYQGCFAKTKLATLKNLINFGLSDSLKEAFPDFNIYLIDQRTLIVDKLWQF